MSKAKTSTPCAVCTLSATVRAPAELPWSRYSHGLAASARAAKLELDRTIVSNCAALPSLAWLELGPGSGLEFEAIKGRVGVRRVEVGWFETRTTLIPRDLHSSRLAMNSISENKNS